MWTKKESAFRLAQWFIGLSRIRYGKKIPIRNKEGKKGGFQVRVSGKKRGKEEDRLDEHPALIGSNSWHSHPQSPGCSEKGEGNDLPRPGHKNL